MGRVLFTVWPLTGHLHPTLAVAGALRARGHDVAFYTGASARPLVEREGFTCFPLAAVNEGDVDRLVLSPEGILSARGNPPRFKRLWKTWVLDTVDAQVRDLEEVRRQWAPDAIVTDPTLWAPFLVLHEKWRMPVAVFSMVPACHLSGRDAPIIGFAVPRATSRAGYLVRRVLRGLSRAYLRDVRREASALRRRHGLPALTMPPTDFAGTMPLYLVPGSRGFDYGRTDLPPSVEYVGPCLLERRPVDPPPAWLADLPPDRPLVYVSEGTVNLEPRVLRAAAQGLGDLPIQVVMTTGRHRDPATLDLGVSPLPANVRVERWVAMEHLRPRLSAMVTIGGPSTLFAALTAGVPVVIVPFDWDHPETAWRVQASGAGLRVAPRDCTPAGLRAAVSRVLREPAFRAAARRLAADFDAAGGPPRAASLIEDLMPPARRAASAAVRELTTMAPGA